MTNVNVSVPAIEKLLDHLASGVGAVGGPWIATWRAKRQAQAALIATKGEAERQRILTGARTESLRAYALAQSQARALLESSGSDIQGEIDLSDPVTARIRFQEEKRERNIRAVVEQAAFELGEKRVEDHEPDHDWTARFFTEVQDVSSEEMQFLWSKVLAGEVERPGSTSVRTLSILRNIDKETAKLFQSLCSLSVSIRRVGGRVLDSRVPSLGKDPAQNGLSEYGLSFEALNVLNENGLIIGDYDSWTSFEVFNCDRNIENPALFIFQGKSWDISLTDLSSKSRKFKLSGVALSQVGKELSPVVRVAESHEFVQALVNFFSTQGLRMVESDA